MNHGFTRGHNRTNKTMIKNNKFYIDIGGICLYMKELDSGTVQGSRLGPILYGIYNLYSFPVLLSSFITPLWWGTYCFLQSLLLSLPIYTSIAFTPQ